MYKKLICKENCRVLEGDKVIVLYHPEGKITIETVNGIPFVPHINEQQVFPEWIEKFCYTEKQLRMLKLKSIENGINR